MKNRTVEVELLGCVGTGATKALAKTDAENKIRATMTANLEPRIITGYPDKPFPFALLWTEHNGMPWYRIYFGPEDVIDRKITCNNGYEQNARKHLAQVVADDFIIGISDYDGTELLSSKEDIAEHRSWLNWQMAYRKAKDNGYTDEQARKAADKW